MLPRTLQSSNVKQHLLSSLVSYTPYQDSDSDLPVVSAMVVRSHLYHTRLVQEHQEMVNRHSLCLSHLREANEEAEALLRENNHLRSFNRELNEHLSQLIQPSVQKQLGSPDHPTQYDIADTFRGLCLGARGAASNSSWEEVSDDSPSYVKESGRVQNVKVEERFSLPKSISVRSTGYLKMVHAQAASIHGGQFRSATHPKTERSLKQKVYVPGGKKQEEPLELEVYNQGMYKTELCNKWQDTGACSYGDHCQFAHGIEELRPVIRHPRYKTEVCRMVLAGIVCPYGHRCHFRHALTEQEKLATLKNNSNIIKMER